MSELESAKTVTSTPEPFADYEKLLREVKLADLCNSSRSTKLGAHWAYYQGTQYNERNYNWDGDQQVYVPNGAYGQMQPVGVVNDRPVTYAERRPACKMRLPSEIVEAFTGLVVGKARFPVIRIEGDPEAEDYVNELAKQCRLHARITEARHKGGACGSVGMSYSFMEGRPRVAVHNARNLHVLSWMDRNELIPEVVLECYPVRKDIVLDNEDGKIVSRVFYYLRAWTPQAAIVWDLIPEPLAKLPGGWLSAVKQRAVEHGMSRTPFLWIQNVPDSEKVDGESDFEGLLDTFDDVNYLTSQTSKGARVNVDPTMVIHEKSSAKTSIVRKGSENAIWSEGGASYLELKGDAIRASKEWLDELKAEVSRSAQAVMPDAETFAARSQSAAGMRMLYMPMIAQADVLRDQYAEMAIIPLLRNLLEEARRMGKGETGGDIIRTPDGRRIQHRPVVVLPPRVEADGDGENAKMVERTPGTSSQIVLEWPTYFPDTPADFKVLVEAATKATGGKAVISQESGIKKIGPMFDVVSPQREQERIEEEADSDQARMDLSGPQSGALKDGWGEPNKERKSEGKPPGEKDEKEDKG